MMRRTCPAQNTKAAFSLIEVIVATAVVAITVAAMSTAILLAQRLGNAADFNSNASAAATRLHLIAFGLPNIENEDSPTGDVIIEEDSISATAGSPVNWKLYRLRFSNGNRSITFAMAGDTN